MMVCFCVCFIHLSRAHIFPWAAEFWG